MIEILLIIAMIASVIASILVLSVTWYLSTIPLKTIYLGETVDRECLKNGQEQAKKTTSEVTGKTGA
jgi:hypothetical protein